MSQSSKKHKGSSSLSNQTFSDRSLRTAEETTDESGDKITRSLSPEQLPRSVRNAPKELRAAIRRRQNNESAKRSRERRRHEKELMEEKIRENELRLSSLERQVDDLADAIISTYKDKSPERSNNFGTRHRDQYPQHRGFPF